MGQHLEVRWSNAQPISSLHSTAPRCWCRVILPAAGLTASSQHKVRSYEVTKNSKHENSFLYVSAYGSTVKLNTCHLKGFKDVLISEPAIFCKIYHMLTLIKSISTIPINSMCCLWWYSCNDRSQVFLSNLRLNFLELLSGTWLLQCVSNTEKIKLSGSVWNNFSIFKITLSNWSIKVIEYIP